MSASDKIFDRVDQTLDGLERVVIGALSVVALGLGTMQVTLRYLFNTGFEWNEAIFVLTTVTAMLMAGVRAVRENTHVRVDVLHMIVSRTTSKMLDVFAYIVSFALTLFYAYCGFLFANFAKMMDTASPETGIKDWIVYSIMPIAMFLFSVRYVIKIRNVLLGREVHDHHAGANETYAEERS
ncbi:hypothetical protein NBRC116586_33050 [Pseudooceanicola nitratireducens]|uniref:TRAP transporter small permease n=1 Tax=Pseudooceanicola nitratireducens TaxID=517719 RepID=UPI00310A9733